MADETSQGLTTSMPMSAPPTPTAPAPPLGAMDKGVTGADPANDPSQSLMAEATRLGGPLGGIAIGAATGAAHHTESQQPSSPDLGAKMAQDPEFLALKNPNEKIQLLSGVDPQFKNLSPQEQFQIVSSLPSRTGFGAANLGNAEDIGTGPEGTIGTDQLMSQASQADASKKGGMLAGAMVSALAAPAAATLVGGGLGGSIVGGGAAGGAQSITEQLAAGENPFRLQMLKQTVASTAIGAGTGALFHAIAGESFGTNKSIGLGGKLYQGVFNKAKSMFIPGAAERPQLFGPGAAENPQLLEAGAAENPQFNTGNLQQVGPEHFTPIPDEEIPTLFPHGTPVKNDQDFTNAVIANMRQGKSLGTDEVNLLKQYVGDKIQSGSTPINTAIGAVKHVTEAINDAGTKMNHIISTTPDFAQSAIEGEIGESLLDDVQSFRERLPLGPDNREMASIATSGEAAAAEGGPVGKLTGDPLNEVFTKRLAASNRALTTTDPKEILKARRTLGSSIDWQDVDQHPETTQQAKNLIDARIYRALTEKLKQIPGISKLDEVFQPNLELRSWLNKVLPEGVAYDPVEAESQRTIELAKGVKKNAVESHNDIVNQNIQTAKAAEKARDARLAENQSLQEKAQKATTSREAENRSLLEKAQKAHDARIASNWRTARNIGVGVGVGAGVVKGAELMKGTPSTTPTTTPTP